jgi:hypothetical protein
MIGSGFEQRFPGAVFARGTPKCCTTAVALTASVSAIGIAPTTSASRGLRRALVLCRY